MRPSRVYDAIVVGIGGVGSAALYHLARRGRRVLGLERFSIPNAMGSSHGTTRILRMAYAEGESYVPLMRRAYELWRDFERETGQELLFTTGSIDAGPESDWLFRGSLQSCKVHNLDYEVLTANEVKARFPAFNLPQDYYALLQPDGGFLLSEECIVQHARLAQLHGADVHAHEMVRSWDVVAGRVRVISDRAAYEAERLLITAGAWVSDLVPILESHAVPERQVMAWFEPLQPLDFSLGHFPVFNMTALDGERYSGLPVYGHDGVKVLRSHHKREAARGDSVDREVHAADETILREFLAQYLPTANGRVLCSKVCLWTNTKDGSFIIDKHPEYEEVLLCSACSGHGYKFASVLGEILADLASSDATAHDIAEHSINRMLPPR